MAAKIAVIYYRQTGNVHKLAEAIAEGARETGAEVRLRRVPELAPEEAIEQNQGRRLAAFAAVLRNAAIPELATV